MASQSSNTINSPLCSYRVSYIGNDVELPKAVLVEPRWQLWDGNPVVPEGYVVPAVPQVANPRKRKVYDDSDAGLLQFLRDLDGAEFEVSGFEADFLGWAGIKGGDESLPVTRVRRSTWTVTEFADPEQ
jgi:hypothetical protein